MSKNIGVKPEVTEGSPYLTKQRSFSPYCLDEMTGSVQFNWPNCLFITVGVFVIWVIIQSGKKGQQLEDEIALLAQMNGGDGNEQVADETDLKLNPTVNPRLFPVKELPAPPQKAVIQNTEGTCFNVIQQPNTTRFQYDKFADVDAEEGNFLAVKTRDIDQLKIICDAFEECKGFNSLGVLKDTIGRTFRAPLIDFYIKLVPKDEDKDIYLNKDTLEQKFGDVYKFMLKDMKIYVYDLKYGTKVDNPKSFMYGSERIFINTLKKSPFLTKDPSKATFYFVPLRCSSYILSKKESLKEGEAYARKVIHENLKEIKTSHGFLNRSMGSDHFYICSHTVGAGLIKEANSEFYKNAIALVTTADYSNPHFVPHKDISVPPNPDHGPTSFPFIGKGGYGIDPRRRKTLMFHVGTLSKSGFNKTLTDHWMQDSDFEFLNNFSQKKYLHFLRTSKFCLFVGDTSTWKIRLIDAIWFGCVPVVLSSSHYELPLHEILAWKTFAIILQDFQVPQLKSILLSVTGEKLEKFQAKLRQVYAHFVWNDPPRPYDAFHSTLLQLWRRRHVIR